MCNEDRLEDKATASSQQRNQSINQSNQSLSVSSSQYQSICLPAGFKAYVGYMHMEAAHTHPVVVVFSRLMLLGLQTKRDREENKGSGRRPTLSKGDQNGVEVKYKLNGGLGDKDVRIDGMAVVVVVVVVVVVCNVLIFCMNCFVTTSTVCRLGVGLK